MNKCDVKRPLGKKVNSQAISSNVRFRCNRSIRVFIFIQFSTPRKWENSHYHGYINAKWTTSWRYFDSIRMLDIVNSKSFWTLKIEEHHTNISNDNVKPITNIFKISKYIICQYKRLHEWFSRGVNHPITSPMVKLFFSKWCNKISKNRQQIQSSTKIL